MVCMSITITEIFDAEHFWTATMCRVASDDTPAIQQLIQLVFYTGDPVPTYSRKQWRGSKGAAVTLNFSDKRGVALPPLFCIPDHS